MPRNALRDVDPVALTLCKVGANRQRIFLRKSAATADLLTLPAGPMPILKNGTDWTTFYCVVATPGAEEDPGLVGETGSTDVWESAEEIRKAAHRLLKNMAYVNTAHDGPPADGVAIVESAVALADLTVAGTTIPEGSWYVGIEPQSAEVRKSIEDGDIEAISLEGTGVRVPLEKSGEVTVTIPGADVDDPAAIIRALAHELDVRKAASFGEIIGAQQLRDALWRATSTLEDVIFTALRDEDESDPKGVIRRSLDEFVDFLAPMLDVVQGDSRTGLAKRLRTLGSTGTGTADQENDMGLAEDFAALKKTTDEQFDAIKKTGDATTAAVEGLVALTGKMIERLDAKNAPEGEGDKTPVKKTTDVVTTLGELCDKVDSFVASVDTDLKKVAADVAALAEGGSSQTDETDTIRKSAKNNGNALAGLLD